jgi:hypothetical protein
MMHAGRRGNMSGGADGIPEKDKTRYLRQYPTREKNLVFFRFCPRQKH